MHLNIRPNPKLVLTIVFFCAKTIAVFVSRALGDPYLSQLLISETYNVRVQTTNKKCVGLPK